MELTQQKQAAIWDRVLSQMSNVDCEPEPELLTFLKRGTQRLGLRGLDIGCGYGRHTLAALQLGFQMTAIDLSSAAVLKTKHAIRTSGFSASVKQASMDSLPFSDEEFDFALSCCVFNHGTQKLFYKALDEAIRVLRCGGYLCGFVLMRDDPRYGKGVFVEKDCFMFTQGLERGICHYFPSKAELESNLSLYGVIDQFKEVNYEDAALSFYHPGLTTSCHVSFLMKKQ